MTAIRTRARMKADGEILGVHSLNHFVVAVPDLKQAERFHTAFGLDVVNHRLGYAVRTDGNDNDWGYFVEGESKRFQHLSFGVFEPDFAPFKKHLEARGLRLLPPPKGFESNGLWFMDHDGNSIEIVIAAKTSPDFKTHGGHVSSPSGVAGAPLRSGAKVVRPTRLAHILIFTRDVSKAVQFYCEMLGMGLSDRSGDSIAFLHGRHGSDHHMIAFVKSTKPGLHHTSWDVPVIDQVGLGAMQMADKGFSQGWGVGRHVLGSNFFHYVRDPWGSYAEYSCDIDYIPSDVEWEAKDHAAEDSFYIWGPTPPEDFGHNYEER
ncbi:metapyrocatechase [Mesorhizobium sp. CGMCC 1.15528]|uniref:Metapyrocatechase n=1 Tax=Mesorhizobium zhangyense TaxID=1776730 RepID=A0A7C9RB15_9HYPH|nr:VOC family protein [Mesorhizobium zhangyense]NGN44660.1 metapyrocatechase [Mesorhizobium zhangyense]